MEILLIVILEMEFLTTTVNGKNYGSGPENVYINKNTFNNNKDNGILIKNAGNNININSNEIFDNLGNGIAIGYIGSNKIQSNVITENAGAGIKFFDNYVKPKSQDISYNVIYYNRGKEVEAKETYYQENGVRLQIGDNWYSDYNTLCPKIKSNNIKFVVKQTGKNQFQATFLDSKGNIASLLPDRTLTVQTNNGQSITLTISGGVATFTTNANDGDLIKAIVDNSKRDNTYDGEISSNSKPVNGQTLTYSYPSITNYQLYEDIGTGGGIGDGDGTGEGTGGDTNKGNGASRQESSSNTGNSTHSQKNDLANNAANQVNDVSQSYDTDVSTSQASASEASRGNTGTPGSESQSVVKQIIMDEDEFFRVTGMSLIVLLIILTVGYYYRDDIKEMNSKR